MTIALAQTIPAIASTGSAASLASNALGSSPTVGNYVTGLAWGWASSGHSVTIAFADSAGGNSWTTYSKDQTVDLWCACGWAKVANTGASFKVTATAPASNGSINVIVAEWSGVAAATPVDGTPTGTTGTSVTVAPGNMTVVAGSLVLAVGTDDNTSFLGSTPGGFTRAGFQNDGSGNQVGEAIYRIGGASPSNPSRTITSAKWAAQQFALLAAAGAAPVGRLVNINQAVTVAASY